MTAVLILSNRMKNHLCGAVSNGMTISINNTDASTAITGGTTNVRHNVVLQPNGGSTEDLVKKFTTHKVLESTRCSQLRQNTQKLYCSPYYHVFCKAYWRECDVGIPYRIPEHTSSLLPNYWNPSLAR
jgi:hypothetical protein